MILGMARIATLGVHVDLPRPPDHQKGYFDYEGVIHWHTIYSGDALGSYKSLSELGNSCKLDFLISTEHNNLQALEDHQEGWHGRLLTLVGIESTRKEGYLLGINFRSFTTRNLPTDAFLSEVSRQGGFTIIAHPRNPRWHWRGNIDDRIVGQEIVDLTDQFATASLGSVLRGLLYYPFNTPAAYLQLYQRPEETLEMWDELNVRRHFVGIYAPDLHQSIHLWGNYKIRFPKTEDILPIAHDHVVLRTPFTGDFIKDKGMLYDAIKRGNVFVAIDSLQDATGFFFSAEQGDKAAWMGDQLPSGDKTKFLVTLPSRIGLKNIIINVYHNGQRVQSGTGPAFSFEEHLPGAYRIEVECDIPTFWGFTKKVTWIYSNPIYLR
jgi:hypothetical protein